MSLTTPTRASVPVGAPDPDPKLLPAAALYDSARRPSLMARLVVQENWTRLRTLLDVALLCVASGVSLFGAHRLADISGNRICAAAFPLLALAVLAARPGPDDRLPGSLLDTIVGALASVSVAAMLTVALSSMFGVHNPTALALRLWLFAAVYLTASRGTLFATRRSIAGRGGIAVPTIVVGAGRVGGQLVERLRENPSYGMRPVGFLDSNPLISPRTGYTTVPVLGGASDLAAAVAHTGAQRVIVAFAADSDAHLVATVAECRRLGVAVSLVPRMYEAIGEGTRLEHVGGLPLVSLQLGNPHSVRFGVKHVLDRALAGWAVLILSPVLLLLAALVRLSSPGPILFHQRRIGRGGEHFDILKFRSMRMPDPAEEEFILLHGRAPGGVEGKDRRTWIGRIMRMTSLDELPQLLNVLRGDMSLVGPRPERPEYVERFSREIPRYADRHRVKPGITGWAQVHGLRGQTSISDRAEWDNYYIRNFSLRLDVQILLRTVTEVLRYREG